MKKQPCPKCGSTEVIPKVRIIDRGHHNQAMNLSATVFYQSGSVALQRTDLARVCGSCGYTEFYVDDPQGLLAIAKRVAARVKKRPKSE